MSHVDFEDHVCGAVNDLLINLPRLSIAHIRLLFVCPRMFLRTRAGMLLEQLYLHLDMDIAQAVRPSCRCCSWHYLGPHALCTHQRCINDLATSMAATVRHLSRSLRAPKVMRIVWPDTTSGLDRRYIDPSDQVEERMFTWDGLDNQLRGVPVSGSLGEVGEVIDLDRELARKKLARKLERYDGLQHLLDEKLVGVDL